MFVNATKVYQFKIKNSEIKDYALSLGNVLKDFNWLKGVVNFFLVDFNPTDNNDILDIHKHLMKITWCKMFGLIKKHLLDY